MSDHEPNSQASEGGEKPHRTEPPDLSPSPWGVAHGYWDSEGEWHDTEPETKAALEAAMGAAEHPDGPPPPVPPTWIVHAGDAERLWNAAQIELEDGTVVGPVDALPRDLPLGYHTLLPVDGWPASRLIVAPPRVPPPGPRRWGWTAQLYAARSRASWGIGDLADLTRLARWSARMGAGVIMTNPLHAATPVLPQQPSPYYPSSRRWRSLLYLRIEDVPGAHALAAEIAPIAEQGRALNDERRIDRDAIFRLKLAALERLWIRWRTAPRERRHREYDRFVSTQGESLEQFAVYAAIADEHGGAWRTWPTGLQHPNGPAVAAFAAEYADRVAFHAWCQWLLDVQLDRAARGGAGVDLIGDLAVGFDPSGADAWAWQDVLALDARVGAPPDGFNTAGQDWGLPPFIPWRLTAAGYTPFIETVRAALRHLGGLRVDHVMGLYRLYWIPPDVGPAHGTYVRYPSKDMLDVLALEASRAGAFVVGEDLGTVQDEVRLDLAARGVLSTRLVWFETEGPIAFPEAAMAAVTTHDLPTIAGVWSGADIAAQRQIGLSVSEAGDEWFRERIRAATDLDDDAPIDQVVVEVHRALGAAPSAVVTATLEDALQVEGRPNMPGTVDQWPNWSVALPMPLEDFERDPIVLQVAGALAEPETA